MQLDAGPPWRMELAPRRRAQVLVPWETWTKKVKSALETGTEAKEGRARRAG